MNLQAVGVAQKMIAEKGTSEVVNGGKFARGLTDRRSKIAPRRALDVNQLNQLDRKERELEAARRISEALFQHLSVEDLIEQGLKIALEVVTCRAGSVLLANPETKELVFYHSVGERPPKPGTAFPWSQGIAGTVFATG